MKAIAKIFYIKENQIYRYGINSIHFFHNYHQINLENNQ